MPKTGKLVTQKNKYTEWHVKAMVRPKQLAIITNSTEQSAWDIKTWSYSREILCTLYNPKIQRLFATQHAKGQVKFQCN
jgi:hypothetical protein